MFLGQTPSVTDAGPFNEAGAPLAASLKVQNESQGVGCIPDGLQAAKSNDLLGLGLPFCTVLLDGLVVSHRSLSPSFDRYHTDYTAEMTTPIVTILPTTRYNATFQVLEGV